MFQILDFVPFENNNWNNILVTNKYLNLCAKEMFTEETLHEKILYKLDFVEHDTEKIITSMVKNVKHLDMREYVKKAFDTDNSAALVALARRATLPPLFFLDYFGVRNISYAASEPTKLLDILLSRVPYYCIEQNDIFHSALLAFDFDRQDNFIALLGFKEMSIRFLLGLLDVAVKENEQWAIDAIMNSKKRFMYASILENFLLQSLPFKRQKVQ